jgi:hypothetical protein
MQAGLHIPTAPPAPFTSTVRLATAANMYGGVCHDTGYPKASALVLGHIVWQGSKMVNGDHGEFSGNAERPMGLRAVTPYWPTDPFGRYTFTNLVYDPGAIAVRNDERVRHAIAESVLTLLYIAWVICPRPQYECVIRRLQGEDRALHQPPIRSWSGPTRRRNRPALFVVDKIPKHE